MNKYDEYINAFGKFAGLTSLKEFRFYQERMKIRTDTFLTFTDKFDFNNPELFNIYHYKQCFQWLPDKYIDDNNLDYDKDKGKAFDFVISLSNNETCKKYIEIIRLILSCFCC